MTEKLRRRGENFAAVMKLAIDLIYRSGLVLLLPAALTYIANQSSS